MTEVVPEGPVAPNTFLIHPVVGKSADARVTGRQRVVQLTQNRWRRTLLVDKAVEHIPRGVLFQRKLPRLPDHDVRVAGWSPI